MSSKSKSGDKSKKNGTANSTDESSPDSTSAKKICIVCSLEASNKIVRDENFEKVMQFYVEGLCIDVKPSEYSKFELCANCFEQVVEFYDTNDVLILLENHLKKLRKGLISQQLAGILRLKDEGLTLHPAHLKVTQKFGDTVDNKDDKPDEPGSSVKSTLEDRRAAASASPGKNSPTKKATAQSKYASTEKENGKRGADEGTSTRPKRRR